MRKKWLIATVILLVLLISLIYIVIPGQFDASYVRPVRCNTSGAFRAISDSSFWAKWWPEQGIKGYSCQVKGHAYPKVAMVLQDGDELIPGTVSILPTGFVDSTMLFMSCHFSPGANPVSRVVQYLKAISIHHEMAPAVTLLSSFLEKKENIYGMDVQTGMSTDSTLVVMQLVTPAYPSTAELYRAIHAIRDYVASQGARETNSPMLHVIPQQDGHCESMVGIPVNKELKGTAVLVPKRFVPWKVLMGEVHGGTYTAERAMDQLRLYADDYHKTTMAASFQSLVTERDQERDTTRWITRVEVPVP